MHCPGAAVRGTQQVGSLPELPANSRKWTRRVLTPSHDVKHSINGVGVVYTDLPVLSIDDSDHANLHLILLRPPGELSC